MVDERDPLPDGSDTGTVTARFDWSTDEPSVAVVRTVAAADGHTPDGLPPVTDSLDPDALDALFRPRPDGRRSDVHVTFTYAGHEVSVAWDGTVVVQPSVDV